MKKLLRAGAALLLLLAAGIAALVGHGYGSARRHGPALAAQADALIARGLSADGLGRARAAQLLRVEDPGFREHRGVDLSSAGAGFTTITQSLGKRVGFAQFRPGWRKIRLVGYALGLEQELSKEQILALHLHHLPMGRDHQGRWMTGLFVASRRIFGKEPAALTQRQFLTLVAVTLAPSRLRLARPSPELTERVDRIERLVQGRCRPDGLRDVELRGCAGPA